MKKALRNIGFYFGALMMAVVPGLNMAVQNKTKPDANDLGGFIYQAIGRTADALHTDEFSLAIIFLAAVWLGRRYLFHKPSKTGLGEYMLCGFFATMMLACASIRATGTVQTLYQNGFQILKVGLYCTGMFLWFLLSLRGLNELLTRKEIHGRKQGKWWTFIQRYPFWISFAGLTAAWLPHILIKYPGVLMWDSYSQFRQFLNFDPRTSSHPPFGTLMYGLLVQLAETIGNYNICYFLFTLIQTACFIAVLSYALLLMQKKESPNWVVWGSFLVFAISPCYVGWSTVIVKDSSYLILSLLTGVLLIDFITNIKDFFTSRWKKFLLAATLVFLILTRHNGLYVAIPALVTMGIMVCMQKINRKIFLKFAALSAATVLVAVGINEVIIWGLKIEKVYLHDWLTIPFQQTARIVKLHGQDIPPDEQETIGKVLDYERIGQLYHPWYGDYVKGTYPAYFEQTVSEKDREEYLSVWFAQMVRYPMDYVDALANMNAVMFDLQDNRPVYISLTDNSLGDFIYLYSFNDMRYYDNEEIQWLNSSQRALTEWYNCFSSLPFIGWFASMGFCTDLMLAMIYLCWINGRKKALIVWIPSVVTAIACLFCPIVYLRYALPYICSLPLWFGAFYAIPGPKDMDQPKHFLLNTPQIPSKMT